MAIKKYNPLRFLSRNPVLKAIMTDFNQHVRFSYIIKNIRVLNESGLQDKVNLTMLDVGAGMGTLSDYFLREFRGFIVNIEYNSGRKLSNMIVADGGRLPFKNDSFDLVVSSDVLEHVKYDYRQNFLKELFRCSKYGVIFTYSKMHKNNPSHSGIHIFEKLCRNFPDWYIEHNNNKIIEDNLIINKIKDDAQITSKKPLSGVFTLFFTGLPFIFKNRFINLFLQIMGYLVTRIIDPPPYYAFGITAVKTKKYQ